MIPSAIAPQRSVRASADTPAEPNRVLLFVELNPKIAAAITRIADELGLRSMACGDVSDVMRIAKETTPDVVLFDLGLPTADMIGCLKALRKCYQTSAAVVLGTCRAEVDREQLSVLLDAGMFAPIYPPLSHENIRQTLRLGLAESMSRKEELAASMGKRASLTRRVEGNSSLLLRPIKCRFHDEAVTVHRYMLRARCIETETNHFDLTLYKCAAGGADFINYHIPAVMVCPKCLFASIDAGHFRDPEDKAPIHTHTTATRRVITDSIDERVRIAGHLPFEFFTEQRTLEQALIAYELAIACSRKLFESNRYTLMNELVRQGNYFLRIAHLFEQRGATLDQTRETYLDAYRTLEQAFMIAEPPVLFKATYQLVALAIAQGEDKSAFQYIARLAEMEKAMPPAQKGSIYPYLSRSQRLWEDRDIHRWRETTGIKNG